MTMAELQAKFKTDNDYANCMIDVFNNGTPTDIKVTYDLDDLTLNIVFRIILMYKHNMYLRRF